MKRLIVNADDFGMTCGINRAIIEAHRDGIVTSTTLMAAGSAFDEAARLARDHPGLTVGCHVTLVQGASLLPGASVPSLATASNGRSVYRYSGFPDLALAALRGRLSPVEITREARAQFQKLQASGIRISHFDSHKHVHLLPQVLRPLLRAACECGIRVLRCPFEPWASVPLPQVLRRRRLWKRLPAVSVLRRFQPEFRRMVAEEGVATADGAIGIVATGCLDEALLETMLQRLPEGTWELVCHPAYLDAQLRSLSTLRTGEREREALTSSRIRECLQNLAIDLISYSELAR